MNVGYQAEAQVTGPGDVKQVNIKDRWYQAARIAWVVMTRGEVYRASTRNRGHRKTT